MPFSVVKIFNSHRSLSVFGYFSEEVYFDLVLGPSCKLLSYSAAQEYYHHVVRIVWHNPALRVFGIFVISYKPEHAVALWPERLVKSHIQLLENSKANAVDGCRFTAGKGRCEADRASLQDSEGYSHNQFVSRVAVLVSRDYDV